MAWYTPAKANAKRTRSFSAGCSYFLIMLDLLKVKKDVCMKRQKNAKVLNVKFKLVVGRSHCKTYKFVDASYRYQNFLTFQYNISLIKGGS